MKDELNEKIPIDESSSGHESDQKRGPPFFQQSTPGFSTEVHTGMTVESMSGDLSPVWAKNSCDIANDMAAKLKRKRQLVPFIFLLSNQYYFNKKVLLS